MQQMTDLMIWADDTDLVKTEHSVNLIRIGNSNEPTLYKLSIKKRI